MTQPHYIPPVFLPSGRPAPWLMTLDELVEFLRLQVRFPRDVVDRMRKRGLHGTQISRRVLYALPDVLEFVEAEKNRIER